jgi:hypothetical protein
MFRSKNLAPGDALSVRYPLSDTLYPFPRSYDAAAS